MSKDNKKPHAVPDSVRDKIWNEVMSSHPENYEAKYRENLENVKFYYEKVLPIFASAHVKPQEIADMLVESCLTEKSFEEGLVAFHAHLIQKDLPIDIDMEGFRKRVSKLSELRLYRKLIHAMGLGPFEDELMDVEITKTLRPGAGLIPSAPRASKVGKRGA